MYKFKTLYKSIESLGLNWFVFRSYYEFKKRSGLLKNKFKPIDINNIRVSTITNFRNEDELLNNWDQHSSFLIKDYDLEIYNNTLNKLLDSKDKAEIIDIADKAINGKIKMFSKWYADYNKPIEWHYNPISNKYSSIDKHWTEIEELGDDFGDVKYIWEVSRFSQVFYFIRAYTLTKDEKYVEAFWNQVESWMVNNPAEMGVNWKCGQEITFRTFAWIFGLYAFEGSKYSTDERIVKLFKYIYYNIQHVEKNFEFALKAVKNNHAVSEAAGMFTAGILFPFFKDAERWKKKGKKYLEELASEQIYSDGTYKQYSTNYNRLVLEVYSFVLRLADLNNIKFDKSLENRLLKSVEYLYQMQDQDTGRVPNYGSNDGALLFPLTSCDYLNYKPQLNLLYYILTGNRLYESGKHEELLFWFCGESAIHSLIEKIERKSCEYNEGGYYIIRNNNNHAMIRCGDFKDRPSHSDLLHFDLWWEGNNILTDAGTYSYNPEKKYKNYFIQTAAHNTITINNENQMKKGPRFLWFDWPKSDINFFETNDKYNYFEGEHHGYQPLIHRRAVYNINKLYIIIDDIFGGNDKTHNLKQNWLLGDFNTEVEQNKVNIKTNNGNYIINNFNKDVQLKIFKGDENLPAGWRSLYYGKKQAVSQIYYEINCKLPYRYITITYPESNDFKEIKINNNLINFIYQFQEIELNLNDINKTPIIAGGGNKN